MFNIKKIFGSRNDRELKKYEKRVDLINSFETKYKSLTDSELKASFYELKENVEDKKKTLDNVLEDIFAITREVSIRTTGMRHFDVQLLGGIVLHEGKISEMKTGEGKTLVATLAVVLNSLVSRSVHIVTVNDYLASRDAEEMSPIYQFLGLSVGIVTSDIKDEEDKIKEYNADVVYGTNNEFGFDYLRDNMVFSIDKKVQKHHYFVIVDEVDSILVDEARTPLIISGPVNAKMADYQKADEVARKLQVASVKKADDTIDTTSGDFVIDEKHKNIIITENGIKKAEELFGVQNLYDLENASLAHNLDQSLKARFIYQKDTDYVVKENQVIIVDEFTGRLSEGRRFSEGLHQALEVKEKVEVQKESQTLADITFQNYFRMYDKLAGMTGTAQTEATEFSQIYNLEVLSIPTNKKIARIDRNDLIYKSESEKFQAVVNKVRELNKKQQPVLIGTASIEKSEALHKLLTREKIKHNILNAKNHEREASIIENAGLKGAVTVATNMAGRGVDIKVNDEVQALGGLFILGTERHESRRIDNQLRGRAGRQGDSGESQFFLSLEDSLLRIFGSDKIKTIMERLGIKEGEHIESKMVTRAVENAQKKVESMHFDSRKHLLEYDDVANKQRVSIYEFRDNLIDENYKIEDKINTIREEYIDSVLIASNVIEDLDSSEYDLEYLIQTIKKDLNQDFRAEELKSLNFEQLKTYILNVVIDDYDKKMSALHDTQRNEIERIIYLQVLDNAWREHLYQMDILKTGIGLRSYNNKDPLVEYKKESYFLFQELINLTKFETYKTLHIVQLKEEVNSSISELKNDLEDDIPDFKTFGNTPKIARNSKCPCGSGKKYKACCGKSGPKKGLLASA